MIQGYSFDQSFTKAGKLKLIEGIRFYYIIPESSFDYKFGELISSCRLIVSFVNLYLYKVYLFKLWLQYTSTSTVVGAK